MTIAACYVCPEGIVLGADSTTSFPGAEGWHYFNFAQKVFEIGEASTLGAVTWGLGGLDNKSYRTMFAEFSDSLLNPLPVSVAEVVQRWIDQFWPQYSASPLVNQCKALHAKTPFVPGVANPDPNARTDAEERIYVTHKRHLVVGFCIGGRVQSVRTPQAYSVLFDPVGPKPAAAQVPLMSWWGIPNMIQRLIFGHDGGLKDEVLNSGKWNGTEAELQGLLSQFNLGQYVLPIREAVDFVHACIYSTIKGLKFSNLSQTCGGPIELAVITSDRQFRWVRHKGWDMAIVDGDLKS